MSSFSYEWDGSCTTQNPNLPVYGKNALKKIKKSALYISLWDHLKNSVYVYTRHFRTWEIYVLFIAHTFPNTDINDIKKEIDELLRELYIIHNNENMGIAVSARNTTNGVLNTFLKNLESISTD